MSALKLQKTPTIERKTDHVSVAPETAARRFIIYGSLFAALIHSCDPFGLQVDCTLLIYLWVVDQRAHSQQHHQLEV